MGDLYLSVPSAQWVYSQKLIKLKQVFNYQLLIGLMKNETWKFILQTLAAILTAIATTLGVQSCM